MARKSLGFMQLTVVCGFSLFYAWYLIAFFGLFMAMPDRFDFVLVHGGQVAFFAGSIAATIAIIIAFQKTDSVSIGHARFLYLVTFVPGVFLPLAIIALNVGIELPIALFYVVCTLAGASVAFGFMLWEDLSTHCRLRGGVITHGVTFCAGGVIFLVCTVLFDAIGKSVIALLLLSASTALLAFITPRSDYIEDKPVAPVREYFEKLKHIDIVVAVINIAFGYAFILLYYYDSFLLLVAITIALVADLTFSVIFGKGKWLRFAGWSRICAAFVSCALLLLVSKNDIAFMVSLCVIVLFWFVFRTMNGGSLTDLANHHDFSAQYCAARGKLPANIGFTAGLAIGLAAVSLGANVSCFYLPLVLVAAFIFTTLFFLPFDSESMTPGYKTLALVDMHEPRDTDMKLICERAAQAYKLSPRESEVLDYLVRGRNAKHISEKLFISESTAKTHISNIYRKFGVHSQQELLDLVDKL